MRDVGGTISTVNLCLSLYVWTNTSTVRGYIYDSHTSLGSAWPQSGASAGEVITGIVGAAVTGVVTTDKLVAEIWCHTTQSMSTAGNIAKFLGDGGTDVINGATTDGASWIEYDVVSTLIPNVTVARTRT